MLEDDAIITGAFAELARQGVDHDIDMLLLYHRHAFVNMKRPKSLNNSSTAYALASKRPAFTVGYYVTRRAADYFIGNSLPLSHPADWPVDLTRIKAFAAHPQPVNHAPAGKGHSYIEHDRAEISKWIKKKNRLERRRGISRILSTTFFKPSYWKEKMKMRKFRRRYTKIS